MAGRPKKEIDYAKIIALRKVGRPPAVVDVEKVRTLNKEGLSIRKIAKILNVSKSKIFEVIKGCPETPMCPEIDLRGSE